MTGKVLIKFIVMMVCIVLLPLKLNAAQIGEGDFVSPTVVNYNGLGLGGDIPAPVVIEGHTHTSDDGMLRYYSFGVGLDAESIGNNTDLGYIDIVLASPVSMAGCRVGISTGNVEFFDSEDNLLGTVTIASVLAFAGWDAEGGNISRIRINDTENNLMIISADDLTLEGEGGIAEPAAIPTLNEWGMIIFMLLAGFAAVFFLKKDKKFIS